jgi:hypothetical protein
MVRDALLGLKVPAWQADGLIEDYAHYRRGEASSITTKVNDITGHLPHRFRVFAREDKETFLG